MVIAAVGQMCSTASMLNNLRQCQTLVKKAAAARAAALFLPEAADYIAASGEESARLCRPVQDSEFVQGLRAEARGAGLAINVGIHEPAAGGRVRNTLIWIDAEGRIAQRYQKLHLFDVEIRDGPSLRESELVEAGGSISAPFDTPLGRVGLMICFDLRFPEISLSLRRRGAQVLTYPSAFTRPTGEAHWETLLRARAIECQAYVIAAAQVGQHNGKRASYGHSMVVDPWGKVVAELGGGEFREPEIVTAEIDVGHVDRVRAQMPLLRRTWVATPP